MNTPDILTEYLQFGGRAGVQDPRRDRRDRRPDVGHVRRLRAVRERRPAGRPRRTSTTRSTSTSRATSPRAEAEGTSLAPYLTMLNRVRRAHPALRQLRNLRVHWSDDDAILVYSKHLARPFTRYRRSRHRHRGRQRRPALGARDHRAPRPHRLRRRSPATAFEVEDLVTGPLDLGTDQTTSAWTRSRSPCTSSIVKERHCDESHVREGAAAVDLRRAGRGRPAPRGGSYHDPHSVLGQHPQSASPASPTHRRRSARCGRSPRAFAVLLDDGAHIELAHVGTASGRAGRHRRPRRVPDRGALRRRQRLGTADDPYRFPPTIGELDLHLIGEGRHERLWDRARRARPRPSTASRHRVRRLGAARPRRPRRRRLQRLGRHARTRCASWAPAASGSCSSPASASGASTSSRSSPQDGQLGRARPTRWRARRDPAGHGLASSPQPSTRWDGRRRGCAPRGDARPARAAR